MQQLLTTSTLLINGPALTLQPPTPISHLTPLTPNFPSPELAGKVPPEALNKWQEYAAMLYSGQMGMESSAALTTLGDYLRKNGWIEAAHCWYGSFFVNPIALLMSILPVIYSHLNPPQSEELGFQRFVSYSLDLSRHRMILHPAKIQMDSSLARLLNLHWAYTHH